MSIVDEILKKISKAVLVQREITDTDIVNRRRETCATCPFSVNGGCEVCGCYIEVKSKSAVSYSTKLAGYEITHCPNGLWTGEDGKIDTLTAIAYREKKGFTPLTAAYYVANYGTANEAANEAIGVLAKYEAEQESKTER